MSELSAEEETVRRRERLARLRNYSFDWSMSGVFDQGWLAARDFYRPDYPLPEKKSDDPPKSRAEFAEAEVQRLREALRKIEDNALRFGPVQGTADDAAEMARAALTTSDKTSGERANQRGKE